MKKQWVLTAVLSLVCAQLASANLIKDGDFESNDYTSTAWNAVAGTFFNEVTKTSAEESTTIDTYAGSVGCVKTSKLIQSVYQNTEYTVQAGEKLTLSFYWAPRNSWAADDEVAYRLFTTSDNTTTGTINELLTGSVGGKVGTYNTAGNDGLAYFGDAVVDTASVLEGSTSVGQQIWVEFYVAGSGINGNEFARVDNVSLDVAAVPEPATFGMFGLGVLAALVLRKRIKA